MRLVIFGLTVSSSWGNGHATLWRGLIAGLAARGHHVSFFEQDTPYYATNRDLHSLPGGELILYESWETVRHQAAETLGYADAAIVTSYCPDALAATELMLDSSVERRVFYDLDSPVTLARLDAGDEIPYIGPGKLAGFDLVLSYAGGATLQALQTRLGARRAAPLYGSVDPAVHRRVAADGRYAADLSYLGTYAADRQPALEALFVRPAHQLPEHRFLIGGSQYPPEFPWTRNIWFVRHVPPPAHPAFYSSSRLTLNVTRKAMAEMGFCPSGRLFEAAACACPVLSDDWEGLDSFFEPGSEILIAGSTDQAVEALSMADGELRRIGNRARERALDEHTAAQRAAELVRLVEAPLREHRPAEVENRALAAAGD